MHARLLPAAAALLTALLGSPLAPPARAGNPEYERKLRAVAPGDFDALFKLADWCMGQGEDLERKGRDHFEDVASRAMPELAARAKYRAGLYALTRGRTYHDLKRGARLLRQAADEGNEAARRRLQEVELTYREKKRDEVGKANRFLSQRKFDFATRAFLEAYRLPTGEGSTSDEALLERLAYAYDEIGKELRRLDRKDVNPACQVCGGTGFQTCRRCKGTGNVKAKKPPSITPGIDGSKYEKGGEVEVKCPHCGGTGGEPCRECKGMGVNASLLPDRLAKSLRVMASSLKRLQKRKDPWDVLRRTWEQVVRNRLHVPAGFDVKGEEGASKFVPPDESLVDRPALEKFWEGASIMARHMFLMAYTAAAAHYLRPVFIHDSGKRSLAERAPLDLADRRMPLSVEVVTGLPQVFHDRWICVYGALGKKKKRKKKTEIDWDDDTFDWVNVYGRSRIPLRSFYWTDKGREKHTLLAKLNIGRTFSHLDRFVWTYKYQAVEEKVDDVRKGSFVKLFGRLIFNPGGVEPVLFEIWDLDLVKEASGKRQTLHPGRAPRRPRAESDAVAMAGFHVQEGFNVLRDEVFNEKKKRRKDDEKEEIRRKRRDLRQKALASFRSAREVLEKALAGQEKPDPLLVELLGHANRLIDHVLSGKGL